MDLFKDKKVSLANPIYHELQDVTQHAADMLGVPVEEVYLLEPDNFHFSHLQYSALTDTPLERRNFEGMPFSSRIHHLFVYKGKGMILYEARDYDTSEHNLEKKSLRYCTYHTSDTNHAHLFLFVPKGKLYRLARHCRRQDKKISVHNDPPILADGLLDKIVNNTVGFLHNKKKFAEYKIKVKRGLMLDGPPGNGKSMTCKYINNLCSQWNIPFEIITASELDDAYQKNYLKDIFEKQGVLFFDDIDISYLNRKSGDGKMACSILSAMDGIGDAKYSVRIFTTNEEVASLDEAFMRPGRIDCCFTLKKPGETLRRKLVDRWQEEIKEAIDVDQLIRETDNFSFADLEGIKTNLVVNKMVGDGTWNLDEALNQFAAEREELISNHRKKRAGF